MSSRLHAVCLAGLFVGCAALLGVGCSDDSTKKLFPGPGEGGEAGEAAGGAPTAGGSGGTANPGAGGEGPTPSEAGQGGAPVVGAAGAPAAGAPSTTPAAGAGGEPDLGGAGAGPLACTPTGATSPLNLDPENQQTLCRGAIAIAHFTASSGDDNFTCCGLSDTASPYSVVIAGVTADGTVTFQVPADAPFGQQSITTTCSSGEATNSFDINVSDSAVLPVITGVTPPATSSDPLSIDGSGLRGVTTITAVSVADSSVTFDCAVETTAEDNATCYFNNDPISPGDYTVRVEVADCGVAAQTPGFTIATQTSL